MSLVSTKTRPAIRAIPLRREPMPDSVAALLDTDRLSDRDRALLVAWLVETSTGRARLRRGLPDAWISGNKTGTCGMRGRTEVNDIAVFALADGRRYVLATYLDGATGSLADAEAIHADVARMVAHWIAQRGA